MARVGMEVDQVAAAGKALKDRSAEIDSVVAKLDGIVRTMPSVWDGPDSQQFVNDWWPDHKRMLVSASTRVAGLGQSALNNASEQREASGTGNSGSTVDKASVLRLGGDGQVGGTAVQSAADRYDLTRSTSDESDGVRIQAVLGDDKELRYVVYLNGTVPGRSDDRGIAENMVNLGITTSTYNHIVQKMMSQIQPPDAQVMIVGYSQGGIHAQLLADSGKFTVTDVMTYGSPNCRVVDSPSSYNIVRIQDVDDNIPKLDPDVVRTAWQSILGDDKGAVDHLLARNNNPRDLTYDTDTSVAGEFGIGTHAKLETYREGGGQFEMQAQSTPEGRTMLDSQSRYGGQIVSDTEDPDGIVLDRGSNTWTAKY